MARLRRSQVRCRGTAMFALLDNLGVRQRYRTRKTPLPMRLSVLMLPLLTLLLVSCATRPDPSDPEAVADFEQTNDPAEPFNRSMHSVHQAIDSAVLRPVAVAYRDVVPHPVRLGISNVLGNLRSPVVLLNDMLQGEPRRAGDTLGRFVINSTIGLGGIFDIAADHFGVRRHDEDWGQTMARWGVGEGPYLFVPVLGPSNPRDLIGFGLGIASDPLNWFGQGTAVNVLTGTRAGMTVINTREGLIEPLDEVERSSLDPYATLRSAYRQRRQAEIENRLDQAAPAAAGFIGSGLGAGPTPPR